MGKDCSKSQAEAVWAKAFPLFSEEGYPVQSPCRSGSSCEPCPASCHIPSVEKGTTQPLSPPIQLFCNSAESQVPCGNSLISALKQILLKCQGDRLLSRGSPAGTETAPSPKNTLPSSLRIACLRVVFFWSHLFPIAVPVITLPQALSLPPTSMPCLPRHYEPGWWAWCWAGH